jgi:hypothetical protein
VQAFPCHGQMKPEQQEVERLRRELKKLKTQRDILKRPLPTSRRKRHEVRLHREAPDHWVAWLCDLMGVSVSPAAADTTDFSVLQNEFKGKSTKIVLVTFDLLYLNGRDLRKLPLIQRKAELRKIVDGTDVQFGESFQIEGREMFAHACKLGLEGVISKVRDGPYPKGRTNDWVKKTCIQRETLTIAGFALDEGKWDGIYVGRRKGDRSNLCGKGRPALTRLPPLTSRRDRSR